MNGNKNEYWLRVLVGKSRETKDKCKSSNSDEGDRKIEMKDTKKKTIEKDDDKVLSDLPIYIGGGISGLILFTSICAGYIILNHPGSKLSNWLGGFV